VITAGLGVGVRLGDGVGCIKATPPANVATGAVTFTAIADFNSDGKADLAASNRGAN
jgi:hypothetical protein